MYLDSWIYKYYDCAVQAENGIVTFIHKTSKQPIDSSRFRIALNIPITSRQYFMNNSDWISTFNNENPLWTDASLYSKTSNGFPCNNAPGTKSLVYNPPFFVTYKESQHSKINFLAFNNELKSNIEESILCMLIYNDEQNSLVPIYQPEISLAAQKYSLLNNIFEFAIYDSNKKQVLVSDKSVLYIILKFI